MSFWFDSHYARWFLFYFSSFFSQFLLLYLEQSVSQSCEVSTPEVGKHRIGYYNVTDDARSPVKDFEHDGKVGYELHNL